MRSMTKANAMDNDAIGFDETHGRLHLGGKERTYIVEQCTE